MQVAAQPAIDAGPILLMLGGALGMSVVIERVLEFSKNIVDLLPTRALSNPGYKAKELDEEYTRLLDRLTMARRRAVVRETEKQLSELDAQIEKTVDAQVLGKLKIEREAKINELNVAIKMAELEEGEPDEGAPLDTLLVQPATPPDLAAAARKFVLIMLSFAAGIVAAHFSGIQLFSALLTGMGKGISPALDYVLTGLFIGGGSQPVHTLIRFITERKFAPVPSTLEQVEVAPARATSAPHGAPAPNPIVSIAPAGGGVAVLTQPAAWIDVPYDGGVDVQLLETTHRRSGPPNLIVFHHTAMHLNSTFEDVVRVIKSRKAKDGKKWLTGYNCVVTADGGIHAFCRWDRFGSHAAGYNDRSLGISLNGNFETLESNRWSNYNGAYGPATPTDAQLHAAARVIALWCTLYEIPTDFDSSIIPHHKVAQKSCPGSNFPYAQLEQLVQDYFSKWQSSADTMGAIRLFARKPYLGKVHV